MLRRHIPMEMLALNRLQCLLQVEREEEVSDLLSALDKTTDDPQGGKSDDEHQEDPRELSYRLKLRLQGCFAKILKFQKRQLQLQQEKDDHIGMMRSSCVNARAYFKHLLQALIDLTSVGEPWMGLFTECGVGAALTKIVGDGTMKLLELVSYDGDEDEEVDQKDEKTEESLEDFVEIVSGLMSRALANCGGGNCRSRADVEMIFEASSSSHVKEGRVGPQQQRDEDRVAASIVIKYGQWAGVETAAVIWPSALYFCAIATETVAGILAAKRCQGETQSDHRLQPTQAQRQLCVMELGCGVGAPSLVSLSLLKLLHDRAAQLDGDSSPLSSYSVRWIMSDVSKEVMDTVQLNLEANVKGGSLSQDIVLIHHGQKQLSLAAEDRDHPTIPLSEFEVHLQVEDLLEEGVQMSKKENNSGQQQVDILIATDLIYDITFTPIVVKKIASLLRKPTKTTAKSSWLPSVEEAFEALLLCQEYNGASTTHNDVVERSLGRGGFSIFFCTNNRDSFSSLPTVLKEHGLRMGPIRHVEDVLESLIINHNTTDDDGGVRIVNAEDVKIHVGRIAKSLRVDDLYNGGVVAFVVAHDC